jgi:hypothetical protein
LTVRTSGEVSGKIGFKNAPLPTNSVRFQLSCNDQAPRGSRRYVEALGQPLNRNRRLWWLERNMPFWQLKYLPVIEG